MRKIAVLGGSFNPVHLAHLAMAEQASARLGLDKVLFIPARIPPHKISAALVSGGQRLEMLRRAIAVNPKFEACDIELRREGPSYSIDTVEELRRQYGEDAEIYFLIGLDSVNELKTWREIRRLSSRCKFVPMDRPGASEPDVAALCKAVGEEEGKAILARRIHMTPMDISSSEVRARVAAGRSISHLVPLSVEEYIHRMGLYREVTSPAPSQPRRCCGGASQQS